MCNVTLFPVPAPQTPAIAQSDSEPVTAEAPAIVPEGKKVNKIIVAKLFGSEQVNSIVFIIPGIETIRRLQK